MRLLVTRPLVDAIPLAEHLAGLGHDVLVSPLIEIELDPQVTLPKAAVHKGLAFTSANGVRALMTLWQVQDMPQDEIAAWRQMPTFAIGPQTASAAEVAGFVEIHQARGDVGTLADLIARHKDDAEPVLHIAGRDRAGDLAALLNEKAVAASRSVLYRADAAHAFSDAAVAALRDDVEPVDGVLLYSQRSAEIFLSLYAALNPLQTTRPIAYCLSQPIAKAMRAAGFVVEAPRHAESAALLALLAV